MTIDILICTIDDGIGSVGQVLMPLMSEVRYVVSMQHTRPLEEVTEWGSALDALRQRDDVTVLTLEGRGLSRNRNHALSAATADILVIADDDCRYVPQMIDRIRKTYAAHPEADVVCFEAESYDGLPMKHYPATVMDYNTAQLHGYFPTSMELTLRRTAWAKSGTDFNEHFGLGAELPAGEEEVWLCDMLRGGCRVLFVPEVITRTDPVTTGDRFLTDSRLLVTKGAVFRHCYGMADALWRTLKEGGHHLLYHHVNPLPIWHNMLRGLWTLR